MITSDLGIYFIAYKKNDLTSFTFFKSKVRALRWAFFSLSAKTFSFLAISSLSSYLCFTIESAYLGGQGVEIVEAAVVCAAGNEL